MDGAYTNYEKVTHNQFFLLINIFNLPLMIRKSTEFQLLGHLLSVLGIHKIIIIYHFPTF